MNKQTEYDEIMLHDIKIRIFDEKVQFFKEKKYSIAAFKDVCNKKMRYLIDEMFISPDVTRVEIVTY